jgi:hypothetical protein
MDTAYVVVTVVTIVAAIGISVADYAGAKFVLANSAAVGVPASWIPTLATLKLAGGIGLFIGLVGIRAIGIAAAVGLVLFFIGAVAVHVRAGALRTLAYPAAYLGLSTASLVLAITH